MKIVKSTEQEATSVAIVNNNAELIAGLRAAADYLEKHPKFPKASTDQRRALLDAYMYGVYDGRARELDASRRRGVKLTPTINPKPCAPVDTHGAGAF